MPSHGQNYPSVAPKLPAAKDSGVIAPPPLEASKPTGDQVIIPILKGIKLVDASEKVVPSGLTFAGIYAADLPTLRADPLLENQLSGFLGKPLTFQQMNDFSKIILDSFQRNHHPLADVFFPEQDVSRGTIQILVIEFRIGQIKVSGNNWFSDDQILSGVRLKPNDYIDFNKLKEDTDWVNQNPFRSVDAVFAKGTDTGKTDLELKTQDQLPLRVYASYDNTGTPETGRNRWNLGGNWGNAFWDNQILSYQFTSSDNFWYDRGEVLGAPRDASFLAHSIDDIIPLPWHDKIDIFGTYTTSKPLLVSDFNQKGQSGQASIRYIHLLPTLSFLKQEVQIGYDHKTTNNNLEFGGEQVYTSSTDIDQFLLTYKGNFNDSYGVTSLNNSFVYSPGGLTAGNNSQAFQDSGTSDANASYFYDNVEVNRVTPLFGSFSAVTRLGAQISGGNLLPSEQLGAGGENSVRGYYERAANGSQGVLFSQELRTPTVNVSKALFDQNINDETQFLTFWDFGRVSDFKTQPESPPSSELSSVGLGVRCAVGTSINVQADYGWQLIRLPTSQNLGSLAHIMITASY